MDEKEKTALVTKVYEDLVSPSAAGIGTPLGEAVERAVRVALQPVHGLLWTIEQGFNWIQQEVTMRLAARGADPNRVLSPKPELLGAALVGLQMLGADPDLRGMFAALLTSAMDERTSDQVHPSFVEVIRQITPREAQVLRGLLTRQENLHGLVPTIRFVIGEITGEYSETGEPRIRVQATDTIPSISIQNLMRLGVAKLTRRDCSFHFDWPGQGPRDSVRHVNDPEGEDVTDDIIGLVQVQNGFSFVGRVEIHFYKTYLELTDWGFLFLGACHPDGLRTAWVPQIQPFASS